MLRGAARDMGDCYRSLSAVGRDFTRSMVLRLMVRSWRARWGTIAKRRTPGEPARQVGLEPHGPWEAGGLPDLGEDGSVSAS